MNSSNLPESKPPVLALVGPTAVGKTALALTIARDLGGEIVSIDSAAVYKGMDIGTSKPSPQMQQQAPHHLLDIVEPSDQVSVADFQKVARKCIAEIVGRGRIPILVGGSGLYFRAVVDPLEFPPTNAATRRRLQHLMDRSAPRRLHHLLASADPLAADRIEPENERRVVRALEVMVLTGRRFSDYRQAWEGYESIYDLKVAGLFLPREELGIRIDQRVDEQFAAGLVDEVTGLLENGYRDSLTSVQALGYAQVLAYLDEQIPLEEAVAEAKRRTRRFARRQLSWFRADPRVRWFETPDEAAQYLKGGS